MESWKRNWERAGLLRIRVRALRLILFLPFVLITWRLVDLQVWHYSSLAERGENQRLRAIPLHPIRGDIFDRNGIPIVQNAPLFQLWATPEILRDPGEARIISHALGVSTATLPAIFRENHNRRIGKQTMLHDNVPYAAAASLLSRESHLKHAFIDTTFQRRYEDDTSLAHILGYIREASSEDRQANGDPYELGDRIGRSGIEQVLNSALFGEGGERLIRVDAAGYPIETAFERPARHGNAVTLSIDWKLQQTAWKLMQGKTGALIAIDPNNGEILASVSTPSMHLEDFRFRIDRSAWRALVQNPFHPLVNRVFQGQYPPGSTYKPLVAIAALAENAITPETSFTCNGGLRVGNRVFRCWNKHGHGSVNLYEAMKGSCDVYFYQLGLLLGVDTIARYASMFGFGDKTGVELPTENSGLVPTEEYTQTRLQQPWQKGDTASVAIGQGYNLVTPAQLARFYAGLALRRRPPQLHLVATPTTEASTQKIPLPDEEWDVLLQSLEAVVSEQGGTGGYSRIPGIRVAGKTGTAQVVSNQDLTIKFEDTEVKLRDHAWFAAWAPVDAPRIVVAAIVENGGHGGSAAAPLVRRVIQQYLEDGSL